MEKKRSECLKARVLQCLVREAQAQGFSAKKARIYAHKEIDVALARIAAAKKRLSMQQKALDAWTREEPCGKIAKSMPHMKAKAKQESNAALADTYGKSRSKVVYRGQETQGAAIVTRKADASARKERERARKWDVGTIARLDAQAERREDCKERAKAREVKRVWHETSYGRKRKVIC